MKSFLKTILILPAFLHAQQETVDSLKRALQNTANDTIRIDIYSNPAEFYQNTDYDSSLLYTDNVLQHARRLKKNNRSSYDIVKAHGGELKVETNEGEGSEFIIQLPIV